MINENFQPEQNSAEQEDSLAEKFSRYKKNKFELDDVDFLELGDDFKNLLENFLNSQVSLKEVKDLRDNGQAHSQSEIHLVGHIINVLINNDSSKKLDELKISGDNSYAETARWIDGLIKNGEGGYHLGDGTEILYREVDPLIWQLAEEFRQGGFNNLVGTDNYHNRLGEVFKNLGREPNNSEGLIIGFLGNKVMIAYEKKLERKL